MKRPNFIFIITDSQGAVMTGCYRKLPVKTPNLDRLAEKGMVFNRAYTTCPLCTPARAAIFTGIYAHTSGPWTNNLALGDNIKTMGQRFEDQGYDTAYAGKWHLDGHDYFGNGICPPGWNPEYWYDGKCYLNDLTPEEIHLWRQELNCLESLEDHKIEENFTWAHRVSDRAVHFLEQSHDRPFLLVASFDEPHHPFTCPPEYVRLYDDTEFVWPDNVHDTLEGKPDYQKEWAQTCVKNPKDGYYDHRLYFGCVSYVDYEIGRILKAAECYDEDTYIIFTSDHGDMMGSHKLLCKGPAMYDEITHIPLIVKTPGSRVTGRRDTLASHIDLLPTMLDAAGMEVPPICEGKSLLSVLDAEEDRSVMIEFNRYEIEHDSWGGFLPIRSIVSGNYKLNINLISGDELYDLAADPGEMKNLIEEPDYAEVREKLLDALLQRMYEKRDPFRGPVFERRPWKKTLHYQWKGLFRPRPADGYAPEVLDYDTGLKSQGIKKEYEKGY